MLNDGEEYFEIVSVGVSRPSEHRHYFKSVAVVCVFCHEWTMDAWISKHPTIHPPIQASFFLDPPFRASEHPSIKASKHPTLHPPIQAFFFLEPPSDHPSIRQSA